MHGLGGESVVSRFISLSLSMSGLAGAHMCIIPYRLSYTVQDSSILYLYTIPSIMPSYYPRISNHVAIHRIVKPIADDIMHTVKKGNVQEFGCNLM